MTSQKWFFWNCGVLAIVWKNLSENNSHAKYRLFSALNSWDMGFQSTNFSILNSLIQCLFLKFGTDAKDRLVWYCVKLQTSLSSLTLMPAIWNFAHVLTAAVYSTWWGLKFQTEKFAQWWRHTSVFYCYKGVNFLSTKVQSSKNTPEFWS